MGTNFYLKKRITDDFKQVLTTNICKIINDVTVNNIDNVSDTVKEFINDNCKKIHICKRSAGWQICFDHNNGMYWTPSRKSLEEWTSNPGYGICDEYGEELTYDEFWEMVDAWNKHPNNKWTSESYEQYERENGMPDYGLRDWEIKSKQCEAENVKKLFGVEAEGYDFAVDGLRFATFTDFS